MQRYKTLYKGDDEQFLVEDLDTAILERTGNFLFPWMLKKTSLKVFPDVVEYPVESDFLAIGYIDNQADGYASKVRPYYTSLVEFLNDPDNRSQIAEIWEDGAVRYGIRNKRIGSSSTILNPVDTITGMTVTGAGSNLTLDTVIFKTGVASARFEVAVSGNTTVKVPYTSALPDGDYKKKYSFVWVRFGASVPTSVTLREHVDALNAVQTTGITTQFAGQAFKANDWNLLAHDLNLATTVGTVGTSPTFAYTEIDMVSAGAGLYWIDEVSRKGWQLMDNWYYGAYIIISEGSTTADKQLFIDDEQNYSTADVLVCDKRFLACIMNQAMFYTAMDREAESLASMFLAKADQAWVDLKNRYPSIEPLMTTHLTRFASHTGAVAKPYYGTGVYTS